MGHADETVRWDFLLVWGNDRVLINIPDPKAQASRRDCIAECEADFSVPCGGVGSGSLGEQIGSPQCDEGIKPEQGRGRPQDGQIGPLSLCLDTEVGAHFGKGDFNLPTPHEEDKDVFGHEIAICAEEGLQRAHAAWVTNKTPSQGHDFAAGSIPQCGSRSDVQFAHLVTVPFRGDNPAPFGGLGFGYGLEPERAVSTASLQA